MYKVRICWFNFINYTSKSVNPVNDNSFVNYVIEVMLKKLKYLNASSKAENVRKSDKVDH